MNVNECINKGKSLGLVPVSTGRQMNNGTIMFLDPKSGDKFGIYLSTGYARRLYKRNSSYLPSLNGRTEMYQLNPAVIVNNGSFNTVTRTLFPNDIEKLSNLIFKRFE